MINSKCKQLIKSLENYHREWDNNKKVYHNKPRHDQWSHACDSMRYLCEGLRFISNARGADDDIKAINSYFGRR